MTRIVIDLDGTLSVDSELPYSERIPNMAVVKKLREYHALGFNIVVHSSRNMRTYSGQIGKINVHTLPYIVEWLNRHDVPFDEIIVGKPWCETAGFYVDDRAVRPSEFTSLSYDQILELLVGEKAAT
ncbi:MAG: capsular biosynthesis protein [Mesorhizobium sp.]|uniref:hypothetical protein n=1 Tax=Mesorhizobium sp. TaxID=1871066 RepID=UPI000FE653C4|nr:hypothetical protein [Mesorhizobium sp.]RWO35484.1 MAG: capsular biosynthesis protein [Mesorhizobium sp.]RWO52431.1 MAG: capsular biosynthesis protein [Mesorhizobium sp.]TJV47198.1 MAG: capsular biosynthesis protein [Mesorhizobium sp.]